MAFTITSSVSFRSSATSLPVSWSWPENTGSLTVNFKLYINNVFITQTGASVVGTSGSMSISINSTNRVAILNNAYENSLSGLVKVEAVSSVGTLLTSKTGDLSIYHGVGLLDISSTANPINMSSPGSLVASWIPDISGIPSDALSGQVKVYCNGTLFYTSNGQNAPTGGTFLMTSYFPTAITALGAYAYGDMRVELYSWFKTGSSTWTQCYGNAIQMTQSRTNGLYYPKTLSITSGTPNFTDTGSLTVTWTGLQYKTNTSKLYMKVNGSRMSKVITIAAGTVTSSYSLGTDALYDELYDKAVNYDFVDAITMEVEEYQSTTLIDTTEKTGGDLTISKRLTSFAVSTAEPLNLDSPTNIISSWTRPPLNNPAFRGRLDVYVNDIACATMYGDTSVNQALSESQINNMIGAMAEVSPGTLKYILTTQFDTGSSYTSLSGTQTITKTNQVIKTFYFKSTGTLSPFTIASTLTQIPFTLTINTPGTTHDLVLKVNGTTITTQTGFTASGNLTINSTMRAAMLAATPTATNTATLEITTYKDAEYVGVFTTSAAVVTIGAEYQPTLTALSHSELNTWVTTLAGGYLQSKSSIGFSFTETPSTGATITQFKVIYNNVAYTSTSDNIAITPTVSGSIPLSGEVTDSRGRTATFTASNVTIKAYSNPTISYFETTRAVFNNPGYTDDTLGEYCHYTFSAAVSSVLKGSTEVNKLIYRIGYKVKGAGSYTYYTPDTDTGVLSKTLESIYKSGYLAANIYEVILEVHDMVYSGSPVWVPITDSLPAATVTLLWGDDYVSVGKIWQRGTLDVGGDIYADNKIYSGGIEVIKRLDFLVTDFNAINPTTLTQGSIYTFSTGFQPANRPTAANYYSGTLHVHNIGQKYATIIMTGTTDGYVYTRMFNGTSWGNWSKVFTDLTDGSGSGLDADLLDGYHTGTTNNTIPVTITATFTPTIAGTTTAGTGTYVAQKGEYTRIGNVVLFKIHLSWSAHTGTGNMQINGFPFTSDSNGLTTFNVYTSALTLSGTGYNIQAYMNESSNIITLAQYQSGGGAAGVAMDTSATLLLSGAVWV